MASRKGAGTPNKLDDPDVYDPGHFSGGPSTSRGSRARPSPNPRWSTVNGRAVMREPSPELPADEEEPEYDYPGNNFSTPVLEPRTLAQSGPKKAQDEELPIYVRGLPGDRSLSAFDVYKFFSRVGKVGSVRLNKFASSRPSRIGEPRQPSTRDCVVYFETCNPKFSSPMLNREAKRMDFPYNGKHYDISVNLDRKYTPRKDIVRPIEPGQNPYFPEDELVLKGFALGNYISPDKFYEQWESTVEARMVIEYEDNTSL
ncbi:hypothetical protein DFS34DRAFT_251686 [Phlyctochytrium arcticum]|nr:hypothetical protein DFS34DRAFT_251686 [Phlyctochytrium arcticum]